MSYWDLDQYENEINRISTELVEKYAPLKDDDEFYRQYGEIEKKYGSLEKKLKKAKTKKKKQRIRDEIQKLADQQDHLVMMRSYEPGDVPYWLM